MQGHAQRPAYALRKLAEDDPALGVLALWCRHRDADGPGLAWTEGETIHYGRGFGDLPPHEQIGLAAHHVLHVAFRHGPRSRAMRLRFGERFDADVYNIAADALVNETLELAGYALPRPSVSLAPLLAQTGAKMDNPRIALAQIDADQLYVLLLHQRRPGDGRSAAADDDHDARAARLRDVAEAHGYARDLGESNEAEKHGGEDADAWQQRLARAMEEGRRAGRGIGALGFRLADLPEVRTPWETRLRGLVTKAVLHERRPTYRRPARRWLAMEAEARRQGRPVPVFQPASVNDRERPRIAVGLDCSASIDEVRLRAFGGEIAAIGRRTGAEVHVLVFDEDVRSRHRLTGADWPAEIGRLDLGRGGGTSFIGVMDAAAALDPSVIVILTDLDGPLGDAPGKVPVVWAVPGLPEARPPFGTVVSLAR